MKLKSNLITVTQITFWFNLYLLLASSSTFSQPVGQLDCVSCHTQQVADWQKSDHAKAMAVVNNDTVLGDFNNIEVSHYTQKALFYKDEDAFKVKFTEGDKLQEYEFSYTFGHYPLQQYLVKTSQGRMQVFPFAWDSRKKAEGGQRWYPNYADEDIQSKDRLHWLQPMQNWNGMCADCHSDGLVRDYSISNDQFSTKWDNINTGCQSCHGEMPEHGQKSVSPQKNIPSPAFLPKDGSGWSRALEEKVASWVGEPRDNSFMDNCFFCHSLRSPLTDGFTPNTPLLDQVSPSLLSHPLYYADGQIKEEVYVYGSFMQSKMYQEGVNCLDCHDTHTMKVKIQGNGLCLQCHSAQEYQQEAHTHHPLDSTGGQCVSCHMPDTVYMGVDNRRDHSFKIPRPNISEQYDTPNACINCHQDKSNQWASNAVQKWNGKLPSISHPQQMYIQLQHDMQLPLDKHLALINDDNLSEIQRASAIMLLPNSTRSVSDSVGKPWIQSKLPLIRLAIANTGYLFSETDKHKSFSLLLDDKYRAVRVAAANQLLNSGFGESKAFGKAFQELLMSLDVTSWRGEGNLNASLVNMTLGRIQPAIDNLMHSIDVDPYFVPSYINLAELYRQQGKLQEEQKLYSIGLANNPKSASLHYAHGMYLIRNGNKNAAVQAFNNAIRFDTQNPQYPYVYVLTLDAIGKTEQAVSVLKQIVRKYDNNAQLIQLGLSFSQKTRDEKAFKYFSSHAQVN